MSGSTTNNALKVLLKRFADGGPLMIQAFSGLTEEQCVAYPVPGTWSIAELAAHLVDCDLVFADRIKRILAEPNPTLLAFDENAWLANLNPNRLPVEEAVALFAANRAWVSRILSLQEESSFAKTGQHSEKGRLTLLDILVYATNHLDHHLKFLYAKRAKLGVSIYPRYTANTGV